MSTILNSQRQMVVAHSINTNRIRISLSEIPVSIAYRVRLPSHATTNTLFNFGWGPFQMKIFSTIMFFGLLSIGCSSSPAQNVQTQPTQSSKTMAQTTQAKAAAKAKEVKLETATFAGGCFWCTEAVFQALEGVDSVLPGYMGGHVKNPTYEQVCDVNNPTGHAEVIQIKFDPAKVSFEDLLFVFFKTHDPTTLNKQGYDEGTQYRSAIFYHTEKQKQTAESILKKIDDAPDLYIDPVVTEITAASTMYVAEDYHINYFAKNPNSQYCQARIPGKIAKLKKLFGDKVKTQSQSTTKK